MFFIDVHPKLLNAAWVMIKHFYTSPERLEQRIAPASLVTITFDHGLLTIGGADGADHDVSLVKTGARSFRVDGHGTDIDVLGQTSKSFHGILSGVDIEGGVGADTFAVTNLSPLRSFRFSGDAGVDTLTATNLRTTAAGRVDMDLGPDTGSIDLLGSQTVIHGNLNVNLGGGGAVGFGAVKTIVDGAVTITGGLASDSVSITGATTLLRKNLTFNGSDGDDSFTSAGRSLTVHGLVSMDGGAGANHFDFAAMSTLFGRASVPGTVDLKLGQGAGTISFTGKVTNIMADLKIDLGTSGGSAHLNSLVSTIRDTVQVTGGAGNDLLGFDGRTSIGKSLSFVGNSGDDTLTAMGGLLSVKGATSMDGGVGASTFDLHPVTLALASLTVTGGVDNDRVNILADGTIAGDVNLQLGLDGTGPSSVVLKSQAGLANGLKFGKNLTIDMVGATVDALTMTNIRIAQAFVAQTGEGVSTVDISSVNTLGNFHLQTGSGADVVNLDNVNARDFYVDTQTGADELRIERNSSYAGPSKILGTATILTGIGADQIRIGDASSPADLKVLFMGAMTLDAGDGANMRNDVMGSNFFHSAPQILSTGGTLTETAAV